MMTPSTYQEGQIILRKRKRQADVYELRYREYMADGTWSYKREALGTVKELPNKKALMAKVEEVRERINSAPKGIFFSDVARRYVTEHIEANLRPHAQTSAKANLRYLEAHFNTRRIADITPGEIDALVNSLKSQKNPAEDLAKHTRQHIKALAHHVWRKAMLWGYLQAVVNPVSIARVVKGRRPKSRSSVTVTPKLYRKLCEDPELPALVKTMIEVAYFTGLRVSEILGLQWQDVDFPNLVIHVRRSAVGKHVDETKNPASDDDVPLHRDLAKALREWKAAEPVWGGWVFGSPLTKRPYHEMNLQQKHLRPAGERLGVKNLGWHNFRHTFSVDLETAGVSDRVQQKAMRHGDPAMTRHYGKDSPALLEKMRKAQNRVVSIRNKKTGTRGQR